MLQLHEPTGAGTVTSHKLQRPAGEVGIRRLRKDARQRLLAETKQREQAFVSTQPALLDLRWHCKVLLKKSKLNCTWRRARSKLGRFDLSHTSDKHRTKPSQEHQL